jgi:hypothetical protein
VRTTAKRILLSACSNARAATHRPSSRIIRISRRAFFPVSPSERLFEQISRFSANPSATAKTISRFLTWSAVHNRSRADYDDVIMMAEHANYRSSSCGNSTFARQVAGGGRTGHPQSVSFRHAQKIR